MGILPCSILSCFQCFLLFLVPFYGVKKQVETVSGEAADLWLTLQVSVHCCHRSSIIRACWHLCLRRERVKNTTQDFTWPNVFALLVTNFGKSCVLQFSTEQWYMWFWKTAIQSPDVISSYKLILLLSWTFCLSLSEKGIFPTGLLSHFKGNQSFFDWEGVQLQQPVCDNTHC